MVNPDGSGNESGDCFSQRLAEAFDHLDDRHRDLIQKAMAEQGLEGGIKGGVARLVGMNAPSVLSDILAGRARGTRHRDDLARWLGVDRAWLEGDDSRAPEWALLPIEAYERWLRQVRISWQAWFMDRQGGGPSATTALGMRLGTDSRHSGRPQLSDDDKAAIAERLDLDPDDAVIGHLAAGTWFGIPFDLQLAIAEELGAPPPLDVEHVRAGHRASAEAAAQRDLVANRFRDQILRYHLPAHLFRLVRLALVTLKQQRRYLDKDVTDVDDALELLWRQQYQREKRSLDEVPPSFSEETGRSQWTRLEDLVGRYESDQAPAEERYASRFRERSPLIDEERRRRE